jgi:glycosyltransferase involved in cell wall biosynthesis
MTRRHVLLVLLNNRGISTYPAVYQTARELRSRGYRVTLLTGLGCDDSELLSYFDDIVVQPMVGLASALSLAKFVLHGAFDCVFAFEPADAFKCSLLTTLRPSIGYVYFNLEVMEQTLPASLRQTLDFQLKKRLERHFVGNCIAMVIQDQLRQRLSQQNGIAHPKTFLIPNSYYQADSASHTPASAGVSLLYSGSLERWSIGDLVHQLPQLVSSELRLTLSGWSRDGYLATVREQLASVSGLTVLESKLTTQQYTELVREHDIGLIWYDAVSDNVRTMGRSSGKFFRFLSLGKPVIVRDLPGLAEDVRDLGLGVVITSLSEMPAAIATIRAEYRGFSSRIAEVYRSMFDFGTAGREFFDWLELGLSKR